MLKFIKWVVVIILGWLSICFLFAFPIASGLILITIWGLIWKDIKFLNTTERGN